MSRNDGGNENYTPQETKDNAGSAQQKPEGLNFTDIMKDTQAQPKVGDAQAVKPAGADLVSDKDIKAKIDDARQHLSPDLKSSIEQLGKVHSEMRKEGKSHEEIQAAQQAHIDAHAQSQNPETLLASIQSLQQYVDKMSKTLKTLQS